MAKWCISRASLLEPNWRDARIRGRQFDLRQRETHRRGLVTGSALPDQIPRGEHGRSPYQRLELTWFGTGFVWEPRSPGAELETMAHGRAARPDVGGKFMTTIVAGGAGFVGSHLCDRLVAQGEEVICIYNLATGRVAKKTPLLGRSAFQFLRHDIVEPLPALPSIDRIYHLASPASPAAYRRCPVETLRANSEGTRRLLETAARHHARILFASTSEVYGDPLEHPQRETYRGNVSSIGPRAMYDEAKRYGEALTAVFGETHGVATRIARIFNTYGPRMDPDDGRIVSNFVVQALGNQPLTVYGDGSQTRSFQYVDDLIGGLVRLMESDFASPVNLGNPAEFTVLDFAELVRGLTQSDSRIEFRPLPVDDPKRRRPDISLAKSVLGWEPRVPVAIGLTHTIAYFRQELERHRIATLEPALAIAHVAD
jgi:nucleoside-diphosphate-sugar epimerase